MVRAVVLATVVALLCPALADAAPLHSDNVTLVGKLPEAAGAASARFSADGKTMYVSTWKGLHTYDVSAPASPEPLGFLPLPHFENEDVDAGDGVVIISNDPSEGVGIIYVIDVSDPALPKVAATIRNGDALGVTNQLGVDDHASNTGHIANCLQACKYLWTTGTEEGIAVWDLRDLTKPRFVKTIAMPNGKGKDAPGFTHDVFVDRSGIAWITGEDGTFGYTTTDPENPVLRYRSDEDVTNSGNSGPASPDTAQDYPLDFLHHNSIRTDIQLAPAPATTLPEQTTQAPAPRARKPKSLRERYRACRKAKHVKRCRARARVAHRKAMKRYRTRTRYVRAGSRTTLGGLGDVMAITEEDYTRPTCNGQGSLQTWQIEPGVTNADGSTKLRLLDQWTTELNGLQTGVGRSPATALCSAHWFDEDRGLIAQGWYDQGVRFLDISNPADIRQVGYWVTAGTFWAAYFAPLDRSVVYGLDVTGGIDVLRIDRSAPAIRMGAVKAPVPQRWLAGSLPTATPSRTWGFACPLLASVVR